MQYEVEIYRNGFSTAPGPEMYYLSAWDTEFRLYTYVFVVKGLGKNILIDTGCGDTSSINAMLAKEFGGKIKFEVPQDESIESILDKAKLNPEDIDYVCISHLHHDHSANVPLFSNAKFVLSRKGWTEYMNKQRPYYYNDILFPSPPLKYLVSLPAERLIFVEEQKEILPDLGVFWVGGHTPGCMAAEVNTRKGKVVFTSDVAFFAANVQNNHPIGLFYNLWECFEAYQKINQRADIIITSHDPDVLDKHFKTGKI